MTTNPLNRDALVVGICQYGDLPMSKQLDTLAKQAEQLAQLLETQGGFKVTRLPCAADLTLDLKKRVTLPELEQAIEKLLSPPKESPTQTALLFFAGHGLVKETGFGREGFLATSEADGQSVYGFSLKTLREWLCKSSVKQQIVFLEACHSGAFFTDFQDDKEHDYCFVTSARAHEPALAEGLLTQALLNLLNCTKQSGGYVTSDSLIKRLQEKARITPGWQRFQWRTHGQKIELCDVTTLKGKLRKIVAGLLKFSWRIIYLSSVTIFLASLALGIFFYYREDFVKLVHETKTEKPTPSISNQPETKKIEKPVQVTPVQEEQEDVQVSVPKTIDSLQEEHENIQVFAQQGLTNISRMIFSSDGKTILSSDGGIKVKLWDAASGREVRTMTEKLTRAVGLGFSNTQTALIADWDRNVWQWDLISGTQIQLMKADYRRDCGVWYNAAFSSDGKKLLGGCSEKTLELWNLESNYILYTLVGHSNFINTVRFSPDNSIAASASEDGVIKLWNLSTGQEIYTLNGHTGGVTALVFSPDGKTILSGGVDKILKLWDISTGSLIRTFTRHSDRVLFVDIAPNGKIAVSGGLDDTAKVWDINTGQVIYTLKGYSTWIGSVTFSPDGNVILSGSKNGVIKFWDTASGQLIHSTGTGGSTGMQSIAVASNGQMVLAGSTDGNLHFWNIVSGKKVRTLKGHSASVNAVAFSPDGHLALSGGGYSLSGKDKDNTIKLWDVGPGKQIYTLKGHSDSISTVAFSPNGQIILTGSSDETIKLWNVKSGQEIITFRGHSNYVNTAVFSPDGRTVLSSGIRDGLRLWEVPSGKVISVFNNRKENGDTAEYISFLSDNKLALVSYFYGTGVLLDLISGKEIKSFEGWCPSDGDIDEASFSPSSQLMLLSCENSFRLWDMVSERELRRWKPNEYNDVTGLSFIPNSHNALSVSYSEPAIRLWNTDTGKEVVKLIAFNDGEWVTITSEGYYQASVDGEKYINIRTNNNQVTGIEEYKHIYHRPDIVQLALKLGDSQRAIAQDGKE
ncbi:MAG: hypothetical protein BWK78_05550 [Thiotrichaceae bacterium IS1]|nr:MAG: hypothetical protein BWK78_05550 [Thiotrichaceae bacterium IS1]